jgi:hypothetical protein
MGARLYKENGMRRTIATIVALGLIGMGISMIPTGESTTPPSQTAIDGLRWVVVPTSTSAQPPNIEIARREITTAAFGVITTEVAGAVITFISN